MIKAMANAPDGKKIFIIGLSFGDLNKFLAEPGDTFIRIDGNQVKLPVDILIYSGETEEKCVEYISDAIDKFTNIVREY